MLSNSMQRENAAINKRFMSSEFKILYSDGKVVVTSGDKNKLPFSVSTHPRKPKITASERARKQAKQRANRIARAELNTRMFGQINSGSVAEWHRTLNGLSSGSIG